MNSYLLQYLRKYWQHTAMALLVLVIFFLVYCPTLFHFFISDDFFVITWLQQAVHSPQKILHTYWGPWLECPNRTAFADASLFYRPFFGTMAFLEYLLWGANGLFFRLVNLAIELLCGFMLSILVALLAKAFNEKSSLSDQQISRWSFFSGFLFILYPLHSEPVNWLSARMDLLVTLFILFSLWSYAQWRRTSVLRFYALSLISAVFAFLTKEMAVALPLIIFAYELFFHSAKTTDSSLTINYLIAKLRRAAIETSSYWVIIVLYFCLRKIVLGGFVAGYKSGMSIMLHFSGWLNGFKAIFIPLNPFLIGSHSLTFKIWHAVMAIAILFTVMAIKRNKANRGLIYFLCVWFFISLMPVATVFPSLMNYASGSRLAYLATAPLCAILTYGSTTYTLGKKFSYLLLVPLCLLIGLAGNILYANNLAWAEAGRLSNTIVEQFQNYYNRVSGDPLLYVAGLPSITDKCINVSIGSLSGMTRRPFMQRDLYNCTRLDSNDQYTSFGFLKSAISNGQKFDLLYWDSEAHRLKPFKPLLHETTTKEWRGDNLKHVLSIPSLPPISQPEGHWLKDGSLETISHKKNGQYTIIEINLEGLPCWNIDFLVLRIQLIEYENLGQFKGAQAFFTNDIAKAHSREYLGFDCCHADLKPTNEEQSVIFSLRNLPAWNLGGNCKTIRVMFPSDCRIQFKEISIPTKETLMPSLYLENSVHNLPGEIHLDALSNSQKIKYDASSMENCEQIVLEIAQPLRFISALSEKNDKTKLFFEKTFSNSHGEFRLDRTQFPNESTIYRARLRALDKTANQVGFPSDYFFINVN